MKKKVKEKIGERLPILRPIEGGPNGDKLVLLEIAVHDGPDLTVRSLPLLHSHIVARERGQHLWRHLPRCGAGRDRQPSGLRRATVAPLVFLAAAARARPVTTGGHIHLCSAAAPKRRPSQRVTRAHVSRTY